MSKSPHAPSFSCPQNLADLPARAAPYWNILEYCRHLGLEKRTSGQCFWLARIRRVDGKYSRTRIGTVAPFHKDGIDFGQAVEQANGWFNQPETQAFAAKPYPVGDRLQLDYVKSQEQFTVGDAMLAYVEWKRIAAAKTTFAASVSLINHHIIPRLGELPVVDLSQSVFTRFCREVLESEPKRGNRPQGPCAPLESLDHERLRKRKKTLNTLIGLLRVGIEMAWENGDVEEERLWRRLRRIPHADTPRQYFLTRSQAKRLIASCRLDLALLVQGALYTGCRVSELAGLKARDVGGHVFGIYVAPMKSYRGRYVILPDEGMTFFLDRVTGLADEDFVFRMESGRAWTESYRHLFRNAVRRAGLPDGFVFHGLRHTYASQLVQAGTPLAVVAKQLGHTNTDTVSRTYGHLCCDSIEFQISQRFAPLQAARKDPRLETLRCSLQNRHEPRWSWPHKNHSRASGAVVEILRSREDELRATNVKQSGEDHILS